MPVIAHCYGIVLRMYFRLYDCQPLLAGGVFARLADEALFQQARVAAHGYGVVWDEELDLAESELWINGIPAEPRQGM
jgi:hypothetical protein